MNGNVDGEVLGPTLEDPDEADRFTTDGSTVWIDGGDGSCIGRFSRFGVDVHTSSTHQLAGGSECLFCTHPPTRPSWRDFVMAMFDHHGVLVPDSLCPEWANS
jgi:hypothetical protein